MPNVWSGCEWQMMSQRHLHLISLTQPQWCCRLAMVPIRIYDLLRIVDFCILFPTYGSCRTHRVGFQPMSSKNPEFHHSILCQPMACLLPWGCVILTAHGGWLGTTISTDWSRIKLENSTIWQFCYLKKNDTMISIDLLDFFYVRKKKGIAGWHLLSFLPTNREWSDMAVAKS